VFEILGIAGIAISVAAYLPQIVHLGRAHCSAGVSSHGLGDVAVRLLTNMFILN
jgi:hypothetical protein